MPRDGTPISPMTLGNMRANGVRSLVVYCGTCHRDVVFSVEAYGDDMPVPAFGPRMVCGYADLPPLLPRTTNAVLAKVDTLRAICPNEGSEKCEQSP